ncbi:SH3 domain-containing protein 3 [Turnera subulata]|uniref:SH3 domain-containing protein 3 n=1 Tax=Turnera subulata TaxID=218843 RepID=A0A9Q0JQ35_9ROSI|nr:SH3 domain-containing protein 3 [Turnera subulata]
MRHWHCAILANAVIKQFAGSGYESSDVMVIDEVEMHRHQQLEKLYRSTRAGKDFQKDLVRAAETFTAIGYKQIEAGRSSIDILPNQLGTKLSEDCCRYGAEHIKDNMLAKAAAIYGDSLKHVDKEQEELNRLLSSQVLDPLRAMINGTPLEDARHLAQRYSRMRQEAETQAAEVSRRQARVREAPIPENVAKLHASEARMQELKANMAVLGKEAATALAAVEAQQQRLSFQRLVAMVEGQKNYHLRIAAILGEVETEAIHPFLAETEKELSLAKGDYVVVRKVTPTGWAEGECKGKAGWFPSAYVEKRQRVPTGNVAAEAF